MSLIFNFANSSPFFTSYLNFFSDNFTAASLKSFSYIPELLSCEIIVVLSFDLQQKCLLRTIAMGQTPSPVLTIIYLASKSGTEYISLNILRLRITHELCFLCVLDLNSV